MSSLSASDEADQGVAEVAGRAGYVVPVGGVHVDGDDAGAAVSGGHEPDGPAAEREDSAVRGTGRGAVRGDRRGARWGRGVDADDGGPGPGHGGGSAGVAGRIHGDVDRDDVVGLAGAGGVRGSGAGKFVPEPGLARHELVELEQYADVERVQLDDAVAHRLGLNR